jgi:outer membrane protein TolC
MIHHRSLFSRALLLAGVAIIAGCTSGPDYKQPDKPKEQGYTPETLDLQTTSAPGAEGGVAQAFAQGRDIPGDWWTLFRSEELSALVNEALRANPDLDAAQA